MDTLTLTGRDGMTVMLFAPVRGPAELRAHAMMTSDPIPEILIFKDETTNRRYGVPPVLRRGLFLLTAPILLPEDIE
ncbi:hypothetical protein GCM10008955_01230 [Deinococcus malanensis]|uniref:YcgL domain-containing protein n=1 Tax=Deinococcus malanensis TaxID=1706855 RepID=A0ABQ2EHP9_9DEIO|nr:hypothetical protein [Deinococcus malanensis]GGK11752.1 hypothetical protein GCM10008955_01230 [Deinococcus malanensis]